MPVPISQGSNTIGHLLLGKRFSQSHVKDNTDFLTSIDSCGIFYTKLLFPQHREEKNSSGKAIYIHKICSNNFLSYSQLALIHFDKVTVSVEELPLILTT